MGLVKKLFKYCFNSDYRFLINKSYGKYDNMPDEIFLKKVFKAIMGYELDLKNPKTFNEKLQWLKLNDRKELYTKIVDKISVRDYVKNIIGEEYLIPLISTYDKVEDINFKDLPNKFAMKCNHNSGLGMCICKNKDILNEETVLSNLQKGLNEDYYLKWREWPYKNVKRRIIVEEFIEDTESNGLKDYKFQCFNGKVDNVLVCVDRDTNKTKYVFFDKEWNYLPYMKNQDSSIADTIKKPKNFDKMIELAEKLSVGFRELRVDLYNINGKIYFGELTLFSQSGFDYQITKECDNHMGSMLNLD